MVSYSKSNISGISFLDIEQIKQGNESAIDWFIGVCETTIAKIANQFAIPKTFNHDALMQAGRISALNAARCFQAKKGNFAGYIRKAIVNAVYYESRKEKRRIEKRHLAYMSELDLSQGCLERCVGVDDGGLEEIDRKDAQAVIKLKIDKWRKSLSSRRQKIIDLVFYQRMNQTQAASHIGLTRSRIGQIMHKILENGKIHLADIAELN